MSESIYTKFLPAQNEWLITNGWSGVPVKTGNGASGWDIILNGTAFADAIRQELKAVAAFHVDFELCVGKKVYTLPAKHAIETAKKLDMCKGLCITTYRIDADGTKILASVEAFASQLQKELLCFRLRVEANAAIDIQIRAKLKNASKAYWVNELEQESEDALCLLTTGKEVSDEESCLLCAAMGCWSDDADLAERFTDTGSLCMVYEGKLSSPITLEQIIVCFRAGREQLSNLPSLALRAAARARDIGYDALLMEEVGWWKQFWEQHPATENYADMAKCYYQAACAVCSEDDCLLPMLRCNQTENERWYTAVDFIPTFAAIDLMGNKPPKWLDAAFDGNLRSMWAQKLAGEGKACADKHELMLSIAKATIEMADALSKAVSENWPKTTDESALQTLLKAALLCKDAIAVCMQEGKRCDCQGIHNGFRAIQRFLNSNARTNSVLISEYENLKSFCISEGICEE